jgi:hypothetical protein
MSKMNIRFYLTIEFMIKIMVVAGGGETLRILNPQDTL